MIDAMHYWPLGGGFGCSVDMGFRTSSRGSVTCPDCKAILWPPVTPEQRRAADEAWTRECATPAHDPDPEPATHAPASIYDDDAWHAYLTGTTAEPTDEERIATLLAVSHPYAEKRAGAVAGFKRTARMLWRHRRAEGHNPRSEAFTRQTMRVYSAIIRNYDRLGRAWAIEQLAAHRDQVEAVTVR